MIDEKPRNLTQDAIVLTIIGLIASYFLGWPVLIIFLLFITAEYYTQHWKSKKRI